MDTKLKKDFLYGAVSKRGVSVKRVRDPDMVYNVDRLLQEGYSVYVECVICGNIHEVYADCKGCGKIWNGYE